MAPQSNDSHTPPTGFPGWGKALMVLAVLLLAGLVYSALRSGGSL